MPINRWMLACTMASAGVLASCAGRHAEVAVAPPAAAPVFAPMPRPPAGATADMTIPARLPDGGYATPNRSLTAAATLWHVRVALNVAALGCRGATGDTIVAAYNAMLSGRKATLAKAHTALLSEYAGQGGYDDAMTRLYNYFAQPGAQAGFCAAAAEVVGEMAGVPAGDGAASDALAKLDAPFVQFYRQYDAYRTELASWQADRLRGALRPVEERQSVAMAVSAPAAISVRAQPPRTGPRLSIDPAIFRMP